MLKKRLEGSVLYVGVDDSNHAGDNKGEIIASVFSTLSEDSPPLSCSNRRDYSKVFSWIKDSQRDYIFTILAEEKFRYSSNNLVLITPFLIKEYLQRNSSLKPEKLKIYLDGPLNSLGKELLQSSLNEKIPHITDIYTRGFIKKGKNRKGHIKKHPECPFLVYAADVIAHDLLGMHFNELLRHDKLIRYP